MQHDFIKRSRGQKYESTNKMKLLHYHTRSYYTAEQKKNTLNTILSTISFVQYSKLWRGAKNCWWHHLQHEKYYWNNGSLKSQPFLYVFYSLMDVSTMPPSKYEQPQNWLLICPYLHLHSTQSNIKSGILAFLLHPIWSADWLPFLVSGFPHIHGTLTGETIHGRLSVTWPFLRRSAHGDTSYEDSSSQSFVLTE